MSVAEPTSQLALSGWPLAKSHVSAADLDWASADLDSRSGGTEGGVERCHDQPYGNHDQPGGNRDQLITDGVDYLSP